jgi:hypothetical protein
MANDRSRRRDSQERQWVVIPSESDESRNLLDTGHGKLGTGNSRLLGAALSAVSREPSVLAGETSSTPRARDVLDSPSKRRVRFSVLQDEARGGARPRHVAANEVSS